MSAISLDQLVVLRETHVRMAEQALGRQRAQLEAALRQVALEQAKFDHIQACLSKATAQLDALLQASSATMSVVEGQRRFADELRSLANLQQGACALAECEAGELRTRAAEAAKHLLNRRARLDHSRDLRLQGAKRKERKRDEQAQDQFPRELKHGPMDIEAGG